MRTNTCNIMVNNSQIRITGVICSLCDFIWSQGDFLQLVIKTEGEAKDTDVFA